MNINFFKELNTPLNQLEIDIPLCSKEDYENIVIPALLRCGAIPKEKLELGCEYEGHCRNSDTAIWRGEYFEYVRYKFGDTYIEKINHFEDDDGYDVFVPYKKLY